MKKLMSVLLCLVIVLSLLAGCSKTPPDSGKPDGNTTGADGAGNDAPDASGERKTITNYKQHYRLHLQLFSYMESMNFQ